MSILKHKLTYWYFSWLKLMALFFLIHILHVQW